MQSDTYETKKHPACIKLHVNQLPVTFPIICDMMIIIKIIIVIIIVTSLA